MSNPAVRRIVNATGIFGLVLCFGCQQTATTPGSASPSKGTSDAQYQADVAASNLAAEAANPKMRVVLSDTKVYPERSMMRILGDNRPIYVAEGRVNSNLHFSDANEVMVKVEFVDEANEVLDTATVNVTDIGPHETKAFRRDIQLLPPPQGEKFHFVMLIDSVKTSPHQH